MNIHEAYEALKPLSKVGYVTISHYFGSFTDREPMSNYSVFIDGVQVVSNTDMTLAEVVAAAPSLLEKARADEIEKVRRELERLQQ